IPAGGASGQPIPVLCWLRSAGSVDVLCAPEQRRGSVLTGTVHYIAWRTTDDASQNTWLQELIRLGYNVSPVMDGKYFHSIYYREPGGVLFEIATDPPGFAVDEAPDRLGTHLVLPAWLEASRPQLELVLPPLKLPGFAQPTL
ncbi:MAG: hypothetical protein ACRD7E_06070, partial [Bryobacteraceae bacterium]